MICCDVAAGSWPSAPAVRSYTQYMVSYDMAHTYHESMAWLTSPPISRIFISFSISSTCCSSAQASAHGMPKSSAELLMTHNVFPLNDRTDLTALLAVETVLVI